MKEDIIQVMVLFSRKMGVKATSWSCTVVIKDMISWMTPKLGFLGFVNQYCNYVDLFSNRIVPILS